MISFTAHNDKEVIINPQYIVSIHEFTGGEEDGEQKTFVRLKTVDGTEYDLADDIINVLVRIENYGVPVFMSNESEHHE